MIEVWWQTKRRHAGFSSGRSHWTNLSIRWPSGTSLWSKLKHKVLGCCWGDLSNTQRTSQEKRRVANKLIPRAFHKCYLIEGSTFPSHRRHLIYHQFLENHKNNLMISIGTHWWPSSQLSSLAVETLWETSFAWCQKYWSWTSVVSLAF